MALVSVKSLTHLALGLFAGTAAIALAFPQGSLAQLTEADQLQNFQMQDNRNPFSSRTDGGQSFSVFDMIHRANLGNSRSLNEFTQDQQQNLDDAAAQFRAKQRERLQQAPEQAVPANQ